jgi:alpha-glucosidase
MDAYQCFTVNKNYFPDLKKLVADLKTAHFETVVMIDCGIFVNENYSVFSEGVKENVFVKRGNGELAIGPVWPARCVFPDYTNPQVRKWWANQYEHFCKDLKISGFWNDMNEPAVFNVKAMSFLDDLQHHYDGHPTNHAKAHNVYGMQMTRASQDGMKKYQPKKRPFLLGRSTYSGGQRYAAIWTGDNVSDWEGLRLANVQVQRLSASGFSFTGSDIGGFAGRPDGELMVRWLQLAIFHPLMRVHSMGNHADGAAMIDEEVVKAADAIDRADQEPWSFGEPHTAASRKAIELRYRLLPYLYNSFYEYVSNKTPIVQSRFLREKNQAQHERDFYFGEHLFVSPILKAGVKTQKIELPEGDWFDFYNHKKYCGSMSYAVKSDEIPLFVKAGTLLPLAPVRQHTKEIITTMELRYYFGEADFYDQIQYEDDGETANPADNKSLKRYFSIEKTNDSIVISQSKAGFYVPTYSEYTFNIIGLKQAIRKIEVEEKGEWLLPQFRKGEQILVSANFEKITIYL